MGSDSAINNHQASGREDAPSQLPRLSHDERVRMLGARAGVIQALVVVRRQLGSIKDPYRPISSHHVRKLKERADKCRGLEIVARTLDDMQKGIAARLKEDSNPLPARED
jgi:hypothetical protein